MEPVSDEMSSVPVQLAMQQLVTLESRTGWIRLLVLITALVTSFWLIYRAFVQGGFWTALFTFVGLSIIFNFGPSPMFAAAASLLCFYFRAVGVWLPLLSYALAIVTLFIDLRRESLRRRIDPSGAVSGKSP